MAKIISFLSFNPLLNSKEKAPNIIISGEIIIFLKDKVGKDSFEDFFKREIKKIKL